MGLKGDERGDERGERERERERDWGPTRDNEKGR